jgi:hypothetical protein
MYSGSIVKLSSGKARRAVFAALLGVAVVAGCFLTERFAFQEKFSTASLRLLRAQLAADQIRLADERLTMSANMAAATGNQAWIKRYGENIPLIDTAIAEALIIAPPAETAHFDAATRASNDRLVELEREAFTKVRVGDLRDAGDLLRGDEYAMHKKILREGTARLMDRCLMNPGRLMTEADAGSKRIEGEMHKQICFRGLKRKRLTINGTDVDIAIDAYEKAVRSNHPVNRFRQVLAACALQCSTPPSSAQHQRERHEKCRKTLRPDGA